MAKKIRSKKAILQAIKSTPGGIVSAIAAKLGVDWGTARSYIDTDPECLAAWQYERERMLDACENTILKSISSGDTQDAKWMLSRLGKKRGYGDELGLTGADGDKIEIIVTYADKTPPA